MIRFMPLFLISCAIFVQLFCGESRTEERNSRRPEKQERNVILITGSSDGIGRETARQVAISNPNDFLILHGRNQSRCNNVTNWLRKQVPRVEFSCVIGEFRDLSDVVAMGDILVREYPDLSILLLNAGILHLNKDRRTTSHGLEETFQLLDTLVRNAPSRIIATSSVANEWVQAHWDDYHSNITGNVLKASQWKGAGAKWLAILLGSAQIDKEEDQTRFLDSLQVYSRTKLYNLMTMDILAETLKDVGVTANSLYPGHMQTKLSGWNGMPVETVKTPAYLITSPKVERITGEYFDEDTTLRGFIIKISD